VSYSMLQWFAVSCSVLQSPPFVPSTIAPPPHALTHSPVPCRTWYFTCTATHCNILQHAATRCNSLTHPHWTCVLSMKQLGAVNESCLIRTAVYVSLSLSVSPSLSYECVMTQGNAKGLVWIGRVLYRHRTSVYLSLCLSVSLRLCTHIKCGGVQRE